ncbi:MAG: hypothetical protein EXR67_00515 [Dehalococcoidia bacterium]|nr:hypothetical protein [Dehalococcoidia bacterium]
MVFDLFFLALVAVFTFAVAGSIWLYRDIRRSRQQENPEGTAWERYLEGQIPRDEYERVARARGMGIERPTLDVYEAQQDDRRAA